MKEKFNVIPGMPMGTYGMEVNLNDTALTCLSSTDLYNAFCKVKGVGNRPIHVKMTVNGEHCISEYSSFFRKLEETTRGNVKIDIYTSGRNFNSLMDCIRIRNSGISYSIHIDDHDIRDVLDAGLIDFSKTVCNCHLSRRYVRNLDEIQFEEVCKSSKYIFDRKTAIQERKVIQDVWREISPSKSVVNKLSSLSKMILVSDYINKNVGFASNGHRVIGSYNGRNVHAVEEWAMNGLQTYIRKQGVCSGQTDLASILLDNHYAKTNCRCINGLYVPFADPHVWIATAREGNYYGICLTMPKRFVDLSKLGYVDGKISLEYDHIDRSDYEISIDSYVDVPRLNYISFCSKVYKFLKKSQNSDEDASNRTPPPLPTRRDDGQAIIPPPLPSSRRIVPLPLIESSNQKIMKM